VIERRGRIGRVRRLAITPNFLVSKQSCGDFELRVEFWVSPDTISGVNIRCQNPER
jgi:hypothetical protein